MNSTVKPILIKKLLKSETCDSRVLFTRPTDVLKMVEKSNSAATVHEQCMNSIRLSPEMRAQKKKGKRKTQNARCQTCIQTHIGKIYDGDRKV